MAEVLPDQKADFVKRLQQDGRLVAMAGRWHQRRAGAGPGTRRCGDGDRHRRGDGECGRDAGQRRPARHRPCAPAEPIHHAQHQAESVLRVCVQRARRPRRGGHPVSVHRLPAQPDHRRGCHEFQFGVRGRQRPTPAPRRTVNVTRRAPERFSSRGSRTQEPILVPGVPAEQGDADA